MLQESGKGRLDVRFFPVGTSKEMLSASVLGPLEIVVSVVLELAEAMRTVPWS